MKRHCLIFPNHESSRDVWIFPNDPRNGGAHHRDVSQGVDPDWYLREWAEHLGLRQAGLVNDLGWDKARASFVWNGKQPYRRDIVNEVSRWLGIEPYELLMHPEEALAIRDLRALAKSIAGHSARSGPAETDTSSRAPGSRSQTRRARA